jgi:hypothetical protein
LRNSLSVPAVGGSQWCRRPRILILMAGPAAIGPARIALHSEDAATRLDSISLERPDTVTT